MKPKDDSSQTSYKEVRIQKPSSSEVTILNYGGGVNSTALIIEMKNRRLKPDYVCFSDTGEEIPETYDYLVIMRKWFKDNGFNFIEVSSKYGKLYDYYYPKGAMPYRKFRDCTDKFKKIPLTQFAKQFKEKGVIQLIGISYEELHRMRTSETKWITFKYPLVEWKINREKCIDIIRKEGLPIPVKSGCYMCPFQSDVSWSNLFNNEKELWNKARLLEENNRSYPKNTLRWSGTLKDLEYSIKTQTKLSDYTDKICGGYCFT